MPKTEIPPSPELKFATTLPAAVLLSMAGGCIDAFIYLNHGHVFAAVMTGNTILLGAGLLHNHWAQSLHNVVPMAAFLLGLFCSRTFQSAAGRRYVTLGLTIEILGLFAASLLPGSFPDNAFVGLVAFFAAYQSASFRKEDGKTYGSTYITSDIRTFTDGLYDAFHPARRREGLQKAREMGLVLVSFFVGAVVADFLAPRVFNHTLWFADVLLGAVVVLVLTRGYVKRRT